MNASTLARFAAAPLLLFSTLFAHAAEIEVRERSYQLGDQGILTLRVPVGWRDTVRSTDGSRPATLTIAPETGDPFEVLVTPFPPLRNDAPVPTPEWVEERVVKAAELIRGQAVESQLVVRRLSGRQAFGAFFTATDKAPKPGEYRYLVQGMLSFGELSATFTILTNDGQEDIAAAAMEMLKEATYRATP